MRLLLLSACTALALSACTTAPMPANQAPTSVVMEKAAAPNDNLNSVAWIQRSVEYRAISEQTFRAAADQLDQALQQQDWDALDPAERNNTLAGLKPAVIMDVDETVLDNSPYQARLVRDGLEYDDDTWALWVEERKARPLPGVLEFARAASERGVTVIYLSNRAVELKQATLENLRAEGLPVAADEVFLGLGMDVPGCEQRGSDKRCRRQLVARDYRVLMQFGDQLGDFIQISPNTPAHRDQLHARHGQWFGQRWWMLPNPTYGSWEPALFDNQWSRPAGERRRAKREALDYAQ